MLPNAAKLLRDESSDLRARARETNAAVWRASVGLRER